MQCWARTGVTKNPDSSPCTSTVPHTFSDAAEPVPLPVFTMQSAPESRVGVTWLCVLFVSRSNQALLHKFQHKQFALCLSHLCALCVPLAWDFFCVVCVNFSVFALTSSSSSFRCFSPCYKVQTCRLERTLNTFGGTLPCGALWVRWNDSFW